MPVFSPASANCPDTNARGLEMPNRAMARTSARPGSALEAIVTMNLFGSFNPLSGETFGFAEMLVSENRNSASSSRSAAATETSKVVLICPPAGKTVRRRATGNCALAMVTPSNANIRMNRKRAVHDVITTLVVEQKLLGVDQRPDDVFVSLAFAGEQLFFSLPLDQFLDMSFRGRQFLRLRVPRVSHIVKFPNLLVVTLCGGRQVGRAAFVAREFVLQVFG